MKIYTSYFANGQKLKKAGIQMIGIALFPPKWFGGNSIPYVAPTWSILHNSSDSEEYTKRFKSEVLAKRDPQTFLKMIEAMSQGKDVALCCFEKPGDFCHRHIVAEWMKETLGLEVSEYVEKQKIEQPTLF